MSEFYMILTNLGLAKLTNAQITNSTVNLTHLAVGDGNGSYYTPSQTATALKKEVWRGPVASVEADSINPKWLNIEGFIPATAGGFTIRELGIFDGDGNLFALGKVPETYKPILAQGSTKDLHLKAILEVANVGNINMVVDPNVIVASRKYVDDKFQIVSTNVTTLQQQLDHILDDTAIKDTTFNTGEHLVKSAIKSPVNVLRIDGKTTVNLPPLFDSGTWAYTAPFTVVAPNELTITPTTTLADQGSGRIRVKPGTPHTLNAKLTNGLLGMTEYTDDAVPVATAHHTKPLTLPYTFTTKSNTGFLRIWLYETALNVKVTFKDITLVEGEQAQPFVANVKGLTNPTIVNETNGTCLVVPTTLYAGEYVEQNADGELVKYRKYGEVLLDDKLTYTYFTSSANNTAKRINVTAGLNGLKTDVSLSNLSDHKLVKYNGMLLAHGTTTLADNFNNTDTILAISIPNADSGWGANYIPTPEEMKVYMKGWQMYDSQSGTTPYNRTDGLYKAWSPIGNVLGVGGTHTLPTTTIAMSSKWQPNRLIYELVTPVQEVIQPYSDLTLEKGDNQVKVYAGRIVNEFNKPFNYKQGSWDRYEINTIQDGLSPLKFNTAKILNVYENGKLSSGWVHELTVQGYERVLRNTHLHDRAAAYTVDYEPLYTWEVTAPIDSVQLQYFETLQAVTNELVHDAAKQQDTMKRMLENVVNEDEGLSGFNLTTINMTSGYVTVTKNKSGYVNVNIYFGSGVWNPGTAIAKLPVGYRPGFLRVATGNITNVSPFSATGTFSIDTAGNIMMAYGTPLTPGQNYTNANVTGNALFKEGN